MARGQARENADHWLIVRTCQHKAAAHSRAQNRQVDMAARRAARRAPARRGQERKGRKAPVRKQCDWHRGWHRSAHPPPPAWRRRGNRSPARRRSCPRAKAAPTDRIRPPLQCAGFHRAVQSRAAAPAAPMAKGLVKTGQSWRQRIARKTPTRFRIVSARPNIPSPPQLSAAGGEMSLKLGRPLGAPQMGGPQSRRRGSRSAQCLLRRWQMT
jgi:hypothetical protein